MAAAEWHQLTVVETGRVLRTDSAQGLSRTRAGYLLRKVGCNELPSHRRVTGWQLFLQQFTDFMVLVLIGATAVSAALGEVADAVAILLIVLVNALLGFVQERRAERSLAALKSLSAPTARVIRDGKSVTLPAREVVPGDLILLEAGDRVPADVRLVETTGLEVDEATFTGESVPVAKTTGAMTVSGLTAGERRNLALMGTVVTRGRGRGLVFATGKSTEMGRIAGLMQSAGETATPLQRRLEELGKWLVGACGILCVGVLLLGLAQGRPVSEMFLTSVSLAVAAIPEGLPAVVTVALAIGVQRMSRRRAIVRRLPAVETLGCTTVICSDKTGTLTRNEMTACEVITAAARYEITGAGYQPAGEFRVNGQNIKPAREADLIRVLEIGVLCGTAELCETSGRGHSSRRDGGARDWEIQGDPTEGALLVAARKAGLDRDVSTRGRSLVGEVPFEPERKMMSVVYRDRTKGREETAYVKGAPDVLLDRCVAYQTGGGVRPLTGEARRQVLAAAEEMASRALRVLGLAYRTSATGGLAPSVEESMAAAAARVERELVFSGLVGMVDPPRPEVRQAIQMAKQAGIRTIMVTGDHQRTAEAIAETLDLIPSGATRRCVTGREMDLMNDRELTRWAGEVNVFARVAPEHKIRLVRALKARGEIVAMTGDGVNDAPAIKEADIGVAMGKNGTEVAKEASAMVLADDNYATIVAAVEEGRGIYDNIRKFVRYLLTCNVGEVLTMALAALLKLPLPLSAIQLLWMNLVTDGIPAVALGFDPTERDVMSRPPRSPREGVFSRGLAWRIPLVGCLVGLAGVGAFLLALSAGEPLLKARTMAFCTLVIAQMVFVFRCRRERGKGFGLPLAGNSFLLGAVILSIGAQVAAVYVAPLSGLLHTVRLGLLDWAVVLVLACWMPIIGDSVRFPRLVKAKSR